MKFVSVTPPDQQESRPATIDDGTVDCLDDEQLDMDRSGLGAVFETYLERPDRIRTAVDASESSFETDTVEIGPPVAGDGRVISLGGAFASHLRERGSSLNMVPSQWVMPETSVIGPEDPIVLGERVSENTRPAVELGVVIGRGGKDIDESEAYGHVVGFTIVNDVTARTDWPGPMAYKLMDTFCPCGPHVVTRDEIRDPHDLGVEIRQDGETICSGRTTGLRFTISFMISYLSTILRLRPGDVIATGDPGEVRAPLAVGETVELEIEDVGVLANPVQSTGE